MDGDGTGQELIAPAPFRTVDLSGRWQVGDGEILWLCHRPAFCVIGGIVWSSREDPDAEGLLGYVLWVDGAWHVWALFGSAGTCEGTSSVDIAGGTIQWSNGSAWQRLAADGHQPPARSLRTLFHPSFWIQWVEALKSHKVGHVLVIAYSCSLWLVLQYCFSCILSYIMTMGADTSMNSRTSAGNLMWILVIALVMGLSLVYCQHNIHKFPASRISACVCTLQLMLFVTLLKALTGLGSFLNDVVDLSDFAYWLVCFAFLTFILALFTHQGIRRFRAVSQSLAQPRFYRSVAIVIGLIVFLIHRGRMFSSHSLPVSAQLLSIGCLVAVLVCTVWDIFLEYRINQQVASEDPLDWTEVQKATEEVREEALHTFNADLARTDRYSFRLEVTDVYTINPSQPGHRFVDFQTRLRPDVIASTPYLGTKMLYHGAHSQGITSAGFTLPKVASPLKPRMFGLGVYFAEVPQKAWTFATDQQYMIMCEVALGHAKHVKQATPSLDHRGLRRRSLRGSLYNSVMGCDQDHGGTLKEKEYVVYKAEQVLPKFLLKVREVPAE